MVMRRAASSVSNPPEPGRSSTTSTKRSGSITSHCGPAADDRSTAFIGLSCSNAKSQSPTNRANTRTIGRATTRCSSTTPSTAFICELARLPKVRSARQVWRSFRALSKIASKRPDLPHSVLGLGRRAGDRCRPDTTPRWAGPSGEVSLQFRPLCTQVVDCRHSRAQLVEPFLGVLADQPHRPSQRVRS